LAALTTGAGKTRQDGDWLRPRTRTKRSAWLRRPRADRRWRRGCRLEASMIPSV